MQGDFHLAAGKTCGKKLQRFFELPHFYVVIL
jgi:hypothetical protein